VHIAIRTPFQHLFELEARLKAVFGIQEAIVIPAVGETSSSILNAIGTVSAAFVALVGLVIVLEPWRAPADGAIAGAALGTGCIWSARLR